jgi:predicted nucleic acid-binding protein
MNYVLDTNIVSESFKVSVDPACDAWLEKHIEDCFITTVTLAELRYGVERLPEGKRKRELDRKLDFLWEDFGERILDFDSTAAVEFGRYVAEYESAQGLQAVEAADVRDFQIAAIAGANAMTIATRNVRHFVGIRCVNPFQH